MPDVSTARVAWPAVIAFTLLACGLAWLVAPPLRLGDGLAEPISAVLLPATMFTPAVAALVVIFAAAEPDLAPAGPLGVASWIVLAAVIVVLSLTGQFRNQPELDGGRGRLRSPPRA